MSSNDLGRLFENVNFQQIENDIDFKEDSVREVIIVPLLEALGYNQENIIRSKALKHPFIKLGSNKKIGITLIPDYSVKVNEGFAFVLDAKSPNQSVTDDGHIQQAFSYAMHPEIQSKYFALCNGVEFVVYRTSGGNVPILSFFLKETSNYWDKLYSTLSIDSFQIGKLVTYNSTNAIVKPSTFDYVTRPLLEEIPVRKQQAKRHFGVHGYFTKQSWNIVNEYIHNFSLPGDLVLDPFGGSGVTAIEALVLNRRGIHVDINPLANFIVKSLIDPININEFTDIYLKLREQYKIEEPQTEEAINLALEKYDYPKNIKLPKNSDVDTVDKLFDNSQLAKLALLKHLIKKQKKEGYRNTLLLMFSGLLNKINLTYHASEGRSEGRGNSAMFAYYRYRIAKRPAYIDILTYLDSRFKKVVDAKKELLIKANSSTIDQVKIVNGSATDLTWLGKETVDYIYTDPPYGKKIAYLDLSVMWNAWLDLSVTTKQYDLEAIEGGELKKSKERYNTLISESIKEMYRVLKFDRWMSFVFAHKDPEFWHLIIETCEACGFEYRGAVPQKNGQTSFKKRQHPFTVLSGQLIINFIKIKNPKSIIKANLGINIFDLIIQTIEGIIAKNNGATIEQINDELIIKGLELGFLHQLKKEYSDLTPILEEYFNYDEEHDLYLIKKNSKFTSHIDLKLRILYYVKSFLIQKERQNEYATFDGIIREILPLLRNGITPENQTILSVLEDIAEKVGTEQWRLKSSGQQKLF